MKTCSIPLINKEMQIKTTMWYDFTPTTVAIKKQNKSKQTNKQKRKEKKSKCWRGLGETGTLIYCWWELKIVQPMDLVILQIVKHRLTI